MTNTSLKNPKTARSQMDGNHHLFSQAGFSLIELVVVVLVVALLAAVAASRFVNVQNDADRAVVNATANALQLASQAYRLSWQLDGARGIGNTSRIDLQVNGINTRFRNGYVVNTNSTAHIPAGIPNRNSVSARIFFAFLGEFNGQIVPRNGDQTGWAMLANNQCAAVTRPRCWAFRRNGRQVARITYASGEQGQFLVDFF